MKRVKSTYKEHVDKLSGLDRLAMKITGSVGTMYMAFAFTLLAFISLPAAISSHDPIIIVSWVAQTFLQLVLLPIILVGQNLQSRHAEIQSEEDFKTNVEAERRIEDLQIALARLETEKLDHIIHLLQKTPSGGT